MGACTHSERRSQGNVCLHASTDTHKLYLHIHALSGMLWYTYLPFTFCSTLGHSLNCPPLRHDQRQRWHTAPNTLSDSTMTPPNPWPRSSLGVLWGQYLCVGSHPVRASGIWVRSSPMLTPWQCLTPYRSFLKRDTRGLLKHTASHTHKHTPHTNTVWFFSPSPTCSIIVF